MIEDDIIPNVIEKQEYREKQIYKVKDIKTSNPRTLFRRLSDTLEEFGYKTNFSSKSVTIKKDEVGNSGYVNANISANKIIIREEEGKGNQTLDFTGASKIKKYTFFIGILILFVSVLILLLSGISQFSIGIALGGIVILIGLISMLKLQAGFCVISSSSMDRRIR